MFSLERASLALRSESSGRRGAHHARTTHTHSQKVPDKWRAVKQREFSGPKNVHPHRRMFGFGLAQGRLSRSARMRRFREARNHAVATASPLIAMAVISTVAAMPLMALAQAPRRSPPR